MPSPTPGLEHPVDHVARDPTAVVAHRHPQLPAMNACAHEQMQGAVRLAVLDRVFDERLHEQWGKPHGQRVSVRHDRHLELRAEPRLLELEIALDVTQLVGERDELTRLHEPAPQMIGEREHEPACALGLGADERRDRVQRVEDEVRLHLRLQGGRGRLRQLRQLQLGRQLVAERLERLDGGLVER